jgi:rhodanese-related sulfurtransferase
MDDIAEISPEALAQSLKSGEAPVLVDVRQPWEFGLVALPGARLVPLHTLPAEADALAPELAGKKVIVYCHHGVRSLTGAAILREVGVDAVSLEGGIDAWSARIDPTLGRY